MQAKTGTAPAAPTPTPAAEYAAQDQRLHELLEKIRKASYDHAQVASRFLTWHHADELASANRQLENAIVALGGDV